MPLQLFMVIHEIELFLQFLRIFFKFLPIVLVNKKNNNKIIYVNE